MTRRFEPYGCMSSNLRGIFLSQQDASWPARGRWSQHLAQRSAKGSPGCRPVWAAAAQTDLHGQGHLPGTLRTLSHMAMAGQAGPVTSLQRQTCEIEKY